MKETFAGGTHTSGGDLSQLKISHADLVIATLGPTHSDSVRVARTLTRQVAVFASFRMALAWAYKTDNRALVPCGYLSSIWSPESWVDLHFGVNTQLYCYSVFLCPLQPICLARRSGTDGVKVALHPATRSLLKDPRFAPYVSQTPILHEVSSKSLGVAAAAIGECDYCIGSLPDIERYENLEVLAVINADMAWTLYRRVHPC